MSRYIARNWLASQPLMSGDGGGLPMDEGDGQTLRFCGDRHAQNGAHKAIRIDLTNR